MEPQRAQRLAEAIYKRRSFRKYDGRPIPPEILGELKRRVGQSSRYGSARVRVEFFEGEKAADRAFKGLAGSYGKVTGAPAFLAFFGHETDAGFYEATGYLGEQVILEATDMGLATCWVSGFLRREVVRELAGLGNDETVVAISPLGYPKGGLRAGVEERSMKLSSRGRGKRRPVEEILEVVPDSDPDSGPDSGEKRTPFSTVVQEALEAVRLAPSAVNRQPWKFRIEGEWIYISTVTGLLDKVAPTSPRLDCGIAMAHFEIAARLKGLTGTWQPLSSAGDSIARFPLFRES